jgi:hypothetical protein
MLAPGRKLARQTEYINMKAQTFTAQGFALPIAGCKNDREGWEKALLGRCERT